MVKIKGYDISRWQDGIDYAVLLKSAEYIILRAGIGAQEDSVFAEHLAACRKHDIPVGVYWYTKAHSVAEAQAEAQKCIEVLRRYNLHPLYPVFYDMEEKSQIEQLDNATRTAMAVHFCEEIKKAGLYPGIYANPSWLENYYNKDELIGVYDIWLAHWTYDPDKPTKYDYGQTMWQWGVEHIGGMDVDADICYADYPKIIGDYYRSLGTDTADKPDTATDAAGGEKIGVGDKVRVKSGALFTNGVQPFDFVYQNIYDIMHISGNEALIGQSGDYTGWMYCADLIPADGVKATPPEKTLSVGDTVKVKAEAKTYGGRQLAAFVYAQHYTVMQVGTANKPDYIVIGQNGNVTAAVKEEDLIKI